MNDSLQTTALLEAEIRALQRRVNRLEQLQTIRIEQPTAEQPTAEKPTAEQPTADRQFVNPNIFAFSHI